MSGKSTAAVSAAKSSLNVDRSGLLQRKCDCGNAAGLTGKCSGCQNKRLTKQPESVAQTGSVPVLHDLIQPKLTVGEPGDKYEQEADRIADRVMRMPEPSIQRQMEPEAGEEGMVQRKAIRADAQANANANQVAPLAPTQDSSEVPSIVHEVLRSPGQPLDPATRAFMEPRFGHDFSHVRVHTDTTAAKSARALRAQAYTVGRDVVFSEGGYTPHLRQGSTLLAHELAHVIQQERGGSSPLPLSGGTLEQAADAAASAFVAGCGPIIHVGGASAPGIARQPLSGSPALSLDKPRSLMGSLSKDEKNLDDAALMREIKLIQDWLNVDPSAPENNHLRSELKLLEDKELERMEKHSVEGLGSAEPKEGSVAKLTSIVHRGRLEVQHGLSPGYDHRFLTKGTMEWRLEPSQTFNQFGTDGWTKRRVQIKFTPKESFGDKTISFLQTKLQTEASRTSSKKPKLDYITNYDMNPYEPFYGMDWDPKGKKWVPESAPPGYKNAPSSTTDRTAYLFDEPFAPPGQVKMFESVAVVPETGETLGALRWGVGVGAERVDCTNAPSADFGAAVERFYATPLKVVVQTDPRDPSSSHEEVLKPGDRISSGHEENYVAILDGFIPNDATLTIDQKQQLDPIVTTVISDPKLMVVVGGFGDAMDPDPVGASEQRAQAVATYLIGKGLPKKNVTVDGYGATWARYTPSMKEGRNRRVQIFLRPIG